MSTRLEVSYSYLLKSPVLVSFHDWIYFNLLFILVWVQAPEIAVFTCSYLLLWERFCWPLHTAIARILSIKIQLKDFCYMKENQKWLKITYQFYSIFFLRVLCQSRICTMASLLCVALHCGLTLFQHHKTPSSGKVIFHFPSVCLERLKVPFTQPHPLHGKITGTSIFFLGIWRNHKRFYLKKLYYLLPHIQVLSSFTFSV
jgi:hypothetical protein